MKVKISITLSEGLLQEVDELVEELSETYHTRSAFLELAAWELIERLRREKRNARDIEIINRRADFLNRETMEALKFQVPL